MRIVSSAIEQTGNIRREHQASGLCPQESPVLNRERAGSFAEYVSLQEQDTILNGAAKMINQMEPWLRSTTPSLDVSRVPWSLPNALNRNEDVNSSLRG
ncbi:hypothetical protein AC579_10317 [Pseudocercospora musae]|uniref:Uncharacterized protein n=1 Tax=Pseudocercospora musae TaxID=113226 RepID=A0A139I2M4_9PEZI|nr:hypothetical protein AC579_10317 [Pseudocercospora musae]